MDKQTSAKLEKIETVLEKIMTNITTKDDLKNLKNELKEYIDRAFNDVFKSADKNKADKSDLIRLERRVQKLERKVFTN